MRGLGTRLPNGTWLGQTKGVVNKEPSFFLVNLSSQIVDSQTLHFTRDNITSFNSLSTAQLTYFLHQQTHQLISTPWLGLHRPTIAMKLCFTPGLRISPRSTEFLPISFYNALSDLPGVPELKPFHSLHVAPQIIVPKRMLPNAHSTRSLPFVVSNPRPHANNLN